MPSSYTRKRKSPLFAGFSTDFFKNLIIGLILIFVTPFVYNYIKGFFKDQADQKLDEIAENPLSLKQAMDEAYENTTDVKHWISESERDELQSYAKTIYESFNIPKKFWQWLLPSYWTEDDKAAYDAILASYGGLKDTPAHEYMVVCYQLISGSAKRDLDRDIQKYLDADYLKIINEN